MVSYTSDDVMTLLDKDPDELVQQLQVALKDLEETKEYVALLKEVLGQKCLDQPKKMLATSYGTVRYSSVPAYRKWDRDRISEFVFRRALDGEDFVDEFGEVRGSDVQRVFELFRRVFRLEPREGQVKALGVDVGEFSSVEGASRASVVFVKEDK